MRSNIGRILDPMHELDRPGSFERRRSLESRVPYLIQGPFRGVFAIVSEAPAEIHCVAPAVPRPGREVRLRDARGPARSRAGGRSVRNDHPGRREYFEGLRNTIAVG